MKHQDSQQDTSTFGYTLLGSEKSTSVLLLAQKLNPQYLGYSPMMAALIGAIIGHDYGARDLRGGMLTGLTITSDGFIIASTTSHEIGAFFGTADDLTRNLKQLLSEANLTVEERKQFAALYRENVTDWRLR